MEKELKPKLPVAPAHFVQHRPFLRRWRFDDCLQQDLKHGIVLQNSMRGAGLEIAAFLLSACGRAQQCRQCWNHFQSDNNAPISVNNLQSCSICPPV